MTFLEFAHILWEKPTIVLADIKSVTRSLQTKAIPPALWIGCDYVLQFDFKKAHIAGSVNTAADFSLQIGTQGHGEDTSQNPGRYPNNTYRSDHLFLGCR